MQATREITLSVGATAEPDTCGSCKFFHRPDDTYNGAHVGHCSLLLPGKYVTKGWDGNGRPPTLMDDTDRCDLWRSDGQLYIVSRRVTSAAG